MRISVVIATKDRCAYLDRALASLEQQKEAPAFEVLVADNGSSDRTKAVVDATAARSRFPVRYLCEPVPNRAKARNRAIAQAAGDLVVFCDDDVQLPPRWLAAHAAAHGNAGACIVNGPILNVPSYEARPKPGPANYSRASLCTCNASVARGLLERYGGFDESFDLYGWEDTELGLRLREAGVGWKFAWDAYLWHIKIPQADTLEAQARKAVEKARMAGRFLAKHPSKRARMATGAHRLNLLRARFLLPDGLLALYAGAASAPRLPAWLRAFARSQLLDGIYARELIRTLHE